MKIGDSIYKLSHASFSQATAISYIVHSTIVLAELAEQNTKTAKRPACYSKGSASRFVKLVDTL